MSEKTKITSPYTRDEDIIALAYTMAIGPERYNDLHTAILARIDAAGTAEDDIDKIADMISVNFAPLEPHFENALGLLHTEAANRAKPDHSIQALEKDIRPGVLIKPSAIIEYANLEAYQQLGVKAGSCVGPQHFEDGQYPQFIAALNTLETADNNQLLGIFGFRTHDDGDIVKMGLRATFDSQFRPIGQLTALNTSWRPQVAENFREMTGITPAELDVVRAVVTGLSLTELADERGRSVGTVRLQAKKLLAKLHLRSQTELACFYAGFCELQVKTHAAQSNTPADATRILKLSDGRLLEYEIIGAAKGDPVLFLPSLVGGTTFTPKMRQMLFEKNIRLIAVWRPGMCQTTMHQLDNMGAFEQYSQDIAELLEALSVKKLPILGYITSAMFAFGLAKHLPEHVERLVVVNSTVPCWGGPHVSKIAAAEKFLFLIMRRAPKVGKMLIHSFLSKIEAGFDEEFLSSFVNNDIDNAFMQDEYIRDTFRQQFKKTIASGYAGFVRELTLGGVDWRPLIDSTTCPVNLLLGEKNPVYTPQVLDLFLENRPHIKYHMVPETAHFLLYQRFDVVMEYLFPDR